MSTIVFCTKKNHTGLRNQQMDNVEQALHGVDPEPMQNVHVVVSEKMVLQRWLPALRCCVGYTRAVALA